MSHASYYRTNMESDWEFDAFLCVRCARAAKMYSDIPRDGDVSPDGTFTVVATTDGTGAQCGAILGETRRCPAILGG